MTPASTADDRDDGMFKRAAHDAVDDWILCALRVSKQQRDRQHIQRDRVVVHDEIEVQADGVVMNGWGLGLILR